MVKIPLDDIRNRLQQDNPWWQSPVVAGKARPDAGHRALFPSRESGAFSGDYKHKRAFFAHFAELCLDFSIRRAVILMGPRRVGKTVMLEQLIQQAIEGGFSPSRIMFASLDKPPYSGVALDTLLTLFEKCTANKANAQRIVIFDEIQYLKDWETHLKALVDDHPNTRFIASGSAAAELKRKSQESGAGRFTDLFLPPLTFAEFLTFSDKESELIADTKNGYEVADMARLNAAFVDYLNFGGYPEAVLNKSIRANISRFLASDIVNKALSHDLPSIYGIQNTQELNRFFSTIAYNTGQEMSPGKLANEGVNFNTMNKYIEYLEAAFLIVRVQRVDDTGKTFKRMRSFKPYLINPCMRSALFAPIADGDDFIGSMVETAIFSQCFAQGKKPNIYYARWKRGRSTLEVDMVQVDHARNKITSACEIKWSDQHATDIPRGLDGLAALDQKHQGIPLIATSKSIDLPAQDETSIRHIPAALYCYQLGKEAVQNLT